MDHEDSGNEALATTEAANIVTPLTFVADVSMKNRAETLLETLDDKDRYDLRGAVQSSSEIRYL